ncbi:MAG: hypothetical protein LQ340_003127 [Diploschistes diacapsis]|nr:MAG: hypothetical protein LQ340_003127 [Diploschistes diacapsis]
MAQYMMDLLYSLTNCLYCFPGSPNLKVNNKTYKMLRLLGEGGFSYVYLVQDTNSGHLYALKKIRCPFGEESVALALRECEAYALFSPHPNIIHSLDYQVVDARDKTDPGSKTVYIILPYYRRGNLQDAINANLVNHTHFPERRLMILFLGVARALEAMHNYRIKGAPGGSAAQERARGVRQFAADEDADAAQKAQRASNVEAEQTPLMPDEITQSQEGIEAGELRAYAHRDIKPGNIMIADDGKTPILMDLGSLATSPVAITSRSLALQVQDTAAEHSTMPYRAPELFDVKTGTIVDTKVDIWSFGCTLYACLVGKSPFEARSEETGGSLSICVLGGDWRFPDEGPPKTGGKSRVQTPAIGRPNGLPGAPNGAPAEESVISDSVKEIVRRCLRVEPAERPDIDEIIKMVEDCVAELPEDGSE